VTTDYAARVARLTALRGVKIKELSVPHIVRLVKESGARSDAQIVETVTRLMGTKEKAVHFEHIKGLEPNGYRDGPTKRLEAGNAIADQKRADAKRAPGMKLTEKQRAEIAKFGKGHGWALANQAFADAQSYEDDSNVDE
jgi:hypothetical protein